MAKSKAAKAAKKDMRGCSVDEIISAINGRVGQGTIGYAGGANIIECNTISTGALPLDRALGVGGVPKGRIVEVFGPESSGKTTLSLSIIAQCQKAGGVAAFIDAEHALDFKWAHNIGVNTESLLITQPDSGEQAIEVAQMLIDSGVPELVVIDSVAALTPQAEIDGDIDHNSIGGQARLMSKAMRKLAASVHNSNVCLLFINQIRNKIGVMFGSPETTSGGKALKFYASVRMDIRKKATIKKGDEAIGNEVGVKVVKNKVAAPFMAATFNIMFGKDGMEPQIYGIDRCGSLLSLASEFDVVQKSGSWFSYNDEKIGNGLQAAVAFLHNNQTIADEIDAKIRVICKMPKRNYNGAENNVDAMVDSIDIGDDNEPEV